MCSYFKFISFLFIQNSRGDHLCSKDSIKPISCFNNEFFNIICPTEFYNSNNGYTEDNLTIFTSFKTALKSVCHHSHHL